MRRRIAPGRIRLRPVARQVRQSGGQTENQQRCTHHRRFSSYIIYIRLYINMIQIPGMPKPKPDAFLPLKSNWFHILICLVEGEQHGYGIMQDVLERSGGKVALWPATLYGSLKRLIEKGLIAESGDRPAPELDDARRRYYKLTPLGRQVLELESQRLKDLVRVLDARRRQEARS